MNRLNKLILTYIFICLPIGTIIYLFFPSILRSETSRISTLHQWGNALSGLLFSMWILSCSYIGMALIFSKKYREQLLTRITGIKERDEREEIIVGRAARNTFLFNLGLLTFIFIISSFQINVSELPPKKMYEAKQHDLSLKIDFSLLKQQQEDSHQPLLIAYSLPFSLPGVLLFLLLFQIGSFYLYSHHHLKE